MAELLRVSGLTIEFATEQGVIRAVDDVSFSLAPGDTLGIVGESGCGKTVTSLALLGLVPSPPGRMVATRALVQSRSTFMAVPRPPSERERIR